VDSIVAWPMMVPRMLNLRKLNELPVVPQFESEGGLGLEVPLWDGKRAEPPGEARNIGTS
jgi:hypothetical protein